MLPGGVSVKMGDKVISLRGAVGVGDDRGQFKAGAGIPFYKTRNPARRRVQIRNPRGGARPGVSVRIRVGVAPPLQTVPRDFS